MRSAHTMQAGGYAARRLIITAVLLFVIVLILAFWVTDGFRKQNWRDIIEWHQYQLEQSEMG